MPIDPTRIHLLNDRPSRSGQWVFYWMQQSQRAEGNPALELAIDQANQLDLPLQVLFALTDGYPEANLRHYRFMLEGLAETRQQLADRGIGLQMILGEPAAVIPPLLAQAALLVCDVGYTRHQKAWRQEMGRLAPCPVVAVEADVVVPVAVVSPKAEYAARTIRAKIQRHLERYLAPCPRIEPVHPSVAKTPVGLDLDDIDALLDQLDIDRTVPAVTRFFRGGPTEARRRLDHFIRHRLARYDQNRNQPQTDDISHLSPYLHFGQISPVTIALAIANAKTGREADRQSYLEELIVRRELAINFVHYKGNYDQYDCLPAWAQTSLAEHADDLRPVVYGRQAMEAADTHDPYWNAAMIEMRTTGFMHNYMRMYWGKKILEWSPTPEIAFATTLALNNKYFLDGRDPNSFAGVGWIYGLHDRAWFTREIFGKVRYMAATGLERKCDINGYVEKVNRLVQKQKGA